MGQLFKRFNTIPSLQEGAGRGTNEFDQYESCGEEKDLEREGREIVQLLG
ncbi:unnamed protein product [Paramecium octaurelia]|uniref:Uncharacterized protein n=1 Tax=Paramecium octaurelia TaxID=43137 RepID=A0A8S1XEL9_PAROT|nr:unnamed protein product [Paramecium octaurelia]